MWEEGAEVGGNGERGGEVEKLGAWRRYVDKIFNLWKCGSKYI